MVGFATMGTASAKHAPSHNNLDYQVLSRLTLICVTQHASKVNSISLSPFYQSMCQLGVRIFLTWHVADFANACADIRLIAMYVFQ